MIEKCHQCGARITEECAVCSRLHPLNTVFCSVEGINIEEFVDAKADVSERLKVFMNLDAFKSIKFWRNIFGWLLVPIDVLVCLGILFMITGIDGMNVEEAIFGSVIFSMIAIVTSYAFWSDYFYGKMIKLWAGRGNKETLEFRLYPELRVEKSQIIKHSNLQESEG